jgi:hypothetical protein
MVQRLVQFASLSRSARLSRAEPAIPMTPHRWAELVLTSLASVGIAFFITIAIGAASAAIQ